MSQDTNNTIGLSRRTVLAGLGAVGIASAGAGLGTTAYFNDTESFQGNTLTAGQFDLLLDWQQTYNGPNGLEQINAYPDGDNDGDQDEIPDFGEYLSDWVIDNDEYDLRAATDAYKEEYFADLPDDFAGPLISLDDVKPGDHGEVTFSAHLFDNPGYLRASGDLVANDDNGLTEPESEVDETGGDGEGELADNIDVKFWYDDGDNAFEGLVGDHDTVIVFDRSYSMVETDASLQGSTNQYNPQKLQDAVDGAISLVDQLEAANANASEPITISVVTFGQTGDVEVPLGNDYDGARSFFEDLPDNPNFDADSSTREGTNIADGISEARDVLAGGDAEGKCMVILGDGVATRPDPNPIQAAEAQAQAAKDEGVTVYTVQYDLVPALGTANNENEILAARELFREMASDANGSAGPREKLSFGTVPNNVAGAFQHIALHKAGEVCLFEGTLREFLTADGLLLDAEPLLTLSGQDAAGQGGTETDETRPTLACPDVNATPFSACSTYYFGFEWSVDTEVGNEIQTDSIEFEIGFDAEQARHNGNPFDLCETDGAVPADAEID